MTSDKADHMSLELERLLDPSTKVNISMMLIGTHIFPCFLFLKLLKLFILGREFCPVIQVFETSDDDNQKYLSTPTDLFYEVFGCSEIHFLP